jgi:hypothetical protein
VDANEVARHPPADLTLEHIGELVGCDLTALVS